jgi:hypothetical protein
MKYVLINLTHDEHLLHLQIVMKMGEKLFFTLHDPLFINSFILLASYGSKFSDQHFRPALVRDVLEEGEGCCNHRQPHREDESLLLVS